MKKSLSILTGGRIARILLAGLFLLSFLAEAQAGKARIELTGSDTISLGLCDVYVEPGYMVYDTGGKAVKTTDPASIFWTVWSDTFDANAADTFLITYHFIHDGDTAVPVYRWVIVGAADITDPTIQLIGDDTVYVEKCKSWSDPGATASDLCDGDLTSSIYDTTHILGPGIKLRQYFVTDASNNSAWVNRRIIETPDATPPTIQLTGDDTVYIEQCRTWTDPGATASDLCDGNVTSNIIVWSTPQFDNMVSGTYWIRYRVADAAGNKDTVGRWVVVMPDTTAPELAVDNPQYDTIYIGNTSWTSPQVLSAQDCTDGDLTADVVLNSNVNINAPGSYTMTYTVTDASNNTATVKRYLVVLDTAYNIAGKVKAGSSPGSNRYAKVYLIKFDPVDTTLTALDTISLSGTDGFTFYDVPIGDYLLKAALDSADTLYASYLPTYYVSSTSGATMWYNAQTISVISNHVGVNIPMVAGTNPGGPGFIGGKVSQGANKKEGDPIEGQLILLTTKDDKPVAYTYSDKDGNYSFPSLNYGEYKVFGEEAGKESIAANITLNASSPDSRNVDLIVKSTEIVAVIYQVKCSAKFTVSNTGKKYTFTGDNTLNKNLSYSWNFGDGMIGTGLSVTHEYTAEGDYNVCLSVDDTIKNCGADSCGIIKINFPILEISGKVSAQGVTNAPATAWLMKHNPGTDGYDIIESQQIYIDDSESAYYLFDQMSEGNYLVKASLGKSAPKFREFMPTYHLSDLKWKNADVVALQDAAVYDADIQMIQVPKITGKGVVRGYLRVGSLKKEGDPIEDIAVLLLDESGNPFSFDLSAADGSYEIANIPNGKYEVYAEVAGMQTYSRWVEITDENYEFSDINFSVHSDNTVTSMEDITASVQGINLFPNPAGNVLNLRLELLKSQMINVTITDMSGKVMMSHSGMFMAGVQTIPFDLTETPAGMYTVTIRDAAGNTTQSNFIKR